VCKVRITSGEYRTQKMSRAYVTHEEERDGVVLACRAFPQSEIHLEVLGKMVGKFVAHSPLSATPAAPAPAGNQ
jgi:Na+-transporting NADH:ubiquinone oxidoreductase subunit NqrF